MHIVKRHGNLTLYIDNHKGLWYLIIYDTITCKVVGKEYTSAMEALADKDKFIKENENV